VDSVQRLDASSALPIVLQFDPVHSPFRSTEIYRNQRWFPDVGLSRNAAPLQLFQLVGKLINLIE
jgi:hypothetical protein